MSSITPKPGEIWKVDVGQAGKPRWFVVVSRNNPSASLNLSLAVPITTKYRKSPYEVALGKLPFIGEECFANIQGITALAWDDFQTCDGRLAMLLEEQIRQALRFALQL